MSGVYDTINSLVPKRSKHRFSDNKIFDYDIGQLIPISCRDCVPGDSVKIYTNGIHRMQPLVSPVLGRLDVSYIYFFVPYRILDSNFESGITGFTEDNDSFDYTFPTVVTDNSNNSVSFAKYGLGDYFGFPLITLNSDSPIVPSAYPFRAYSLIWNDWFRDENLQDSNKINEFSDIIKNVAWSRDYFTSALLTQQKGTAPSFPISGMLPIINSNPNNIDVDGDFNFNLLGRLSGSPTRSNFLGVSTTSLSGSSFNSYNTQFVKSPSDSGLAVNLADGVSFDVATLRQVVQLQKVLERANRTGTRYTEYLRSFFSVSPRDDRLQRPEYIGSLKVPIVFNDVVQTSTPSDSTGGNTPTGQLRGKGSSVGGDFIGSYFVQEYGLIMGLMFARPKTLYQQGINRQWIKKSRFDFYLPQFCNLSEQEVYSAEIYADGSADDSSLFGFQGRYNEMRSGTTSVCGAMRSEFDYWHFGRKFNTRPNLNSSFIECLPSETKKIYAVQDVPGLIAQVSTSYEMVRPITTRPEPGRLDHDM